MLWAASIATSATTAAATQRPGWRAGIALIGAAAGPDWPGPPLVATSLTVLADRPVDHGVVDGDRLHAPLLQDLQVDAVGDHLLQRRLDRLRHARSLRHRDAVGDDAVGAAGERELAVRLGDGIVGDRGVGHRRVHAAGGKRRIGAVLVGEGLDVDLRL